MKNLNKVVFKIGKSVYEYNLFMLKYSKSIKKICGEESFRNFFKILHLKNTLFKQYLNDMVISHRLYKDEKLIVSIDSSLGNDKYNFNEFLHSFLRDFEEIWFLIYDDRNQFQNRDETLKKFISALELPSMYMRYIYE